MAENAPVITMQPVVENQSSDGFVLWPVAEVTPFDSFLHGLLTSDVPFAAGGLRVIDGSTGSTFRPGCCTGLDERHEW